MGTPRFVRAATAILGLGPFAALPSAAQSLMTSTVIVGQARFQFLTASLVRLEYAPAGGFADASSAVVQKRDWPAVAVERSDHDGWLELRTDAITLRYRKDSGAFSPSNLEITWRDRAGGTHTWHPGDVDAKNLGGLTYSLDNIGRVNLPQGQMDLESPVNDSIPGIDLILPPAKPGLLSRSGYAFIDDSETPLWNPGQTWIEPRQQPYGQDWYLFAYDRDYRRVLGEYAQLCGPIPMIPRFVLGAWITDFNFEYFPDSSEAQRPEFKRYNQQYLMDEVTRLRGYHIPFDTLVLDFAWHNYGWDGGYDWSPLFPQPQQLMDWLHRQGVKLSLNDHPGYVHTRESILSYSDSHAPAALAALDQSLPPKASFDLDLSRQWSFAPDPLDEGLRQRWFATDAGKVSWKSVRVGAPWQEQGYPKLRGAGWYRVAFRLPADLPPTLYLYLGEVEKSYRIFVNGKEATPRPIHWPQRLTATDISPYLVVGAENRIVLRVEPGRHGGGIVLGPAAIRDLPPPERIFFDLSNQKQADVSMQHLHGPLMQQGVDVWWVDGGSGAVDMPGLDQQLWTNKVFYDFSAQQTGRRAFILGRYGDWGSERYPGFFTGDTYSEWPVLAYEVAYSARGGNVLVPYISHDIGGFHGGKIDFDLYARWIEFGTFSGILRMHSAHANPLEGNLRVPWLYGAQGVDLMRKYFTLRTQLIPYIYSYAWRAHEESLPLLQPLYLQYPELEDAYQHSHEYFFGDGMLVAPVLDPSGNQSIYLPPGDWFDFFSGRRHVGATTFTAHYAVADTPVFVRDGAIIPQQSVSAYSDAKPLDRLILSVYGSGAGSFDLYEDDGSSFEYRDGQQAHTSMRHDAGSEGRQRLVIEPTKGAYRGQPAARSYELQLFAGAKPSTITIDGRDVDAWTWDAARSAATVEVPSRSIRERLSVEWR